MLPMLWNRQLLRHPRCVSAGLMSTRCFANFTMRRTNRPRDREWVGRTDLLNGGPQQMSLNVREIALSDSGDAVRRSGALHTRKWPGSLGSHLKNEYVFRPDAAVSLFRMKTCAVDEVVLASARAGELETKTIENALFESSRGFAVQILLEGRGVRAHLEPAWPHLKVRLGVGGMMRDFTWLCERDPEVIGHLHDKTGTILVLHGPTKAQVAKVAMAVTLANKASPYSGKGAHLAFNPVRRRTPKKKKKGGK